MFVAPKRRVRCSHSNSGLLISESKLQILALQKYAATTGHEIARLMELLAAEAGKNQKLEEMLSAESDRRRKAEDLARDYEASLATITTTLEKCQVDLANAEELLKSKVDDSEKLKLAEARLISLVQPLNQMTSAAFGKPASLCII